MVRGRLGGLLQFSKGNDVKIFLASVLSGIRAMLPNREKHRAWITAEISHAKLLAQASYGLSATAELLVTTTRVFLTSPFWVTALELYIIQRRLILKKLE